jgi:hypothetical protein
LTCEFLHESGRYAKVDALSGQFVHESGRYADLDRPRSPSSSEGPTGVVGEGPPAREHERELLSLLDRSIVPVSVT